MKEPPLGPLDLVTEVIVALRNGGWGLDPVEDNPNAWTAQCPYCGSQGSLIVRDLGELLTNGAGSPLFVRCETGHCAPRSILQTLGIDPERMGSAKTNGAAPAEEEARPRESWLEDAAVLLGEDDPGPTPMAVEELLVDGGIGAIQGSWKVGKTWLLLEFAIALVTGQPALDRYEIPQPGPVIIVLEESGRAALHRRLAALARGHRLDPADLAGLHFAANRRIRLNDKGWQRSLIDAGKDLGARAIFLDPLARLKGAEVDENVQREMGPVLDFMRELRDETGSSVDFVHHTGHLDKGRFRGSSDLEAYWESKVTLMRETGGVLSLAAEHREAEAGEGCRYRLAWHQPSRSVRLAVISSELKPKGREQVEAALREAGARGSALTQAELQDITGLKERAIRDALQGLGLRGEGRPKYYRLAPQDEDDGEQELEWE